MARYRSRSRSYSPPGRSRTPPRGRKRYDDEPRERHRDRRSYRDRRSPAPCGLLVRNLPLHARPEDLRVPFERYGALKDVYLPRNYYTGQPRGFGFVKFRYAEDAAEAKQHLDHTVIGGREITIVFAEENRKTPQEMRKIARMSDQYRGSGRRITPSRSPRHRYRSYSRSPSPPGDDSRDRRDRDDYRSAERSRSYSRSPSPHGEKDYRRSPSPKENGRSPNDKRDHTPSRSGSPRCNGHSPSRSRSRSYSPR